MSESDSSLPDLIDSSDEDNPDIKTHTLAAAYYAERWLEKNEDFLENQELWNRVFCLGPFLFGVNNIIAAAWIKALSNAKLILDESRQFHITLLKWEEWECVDLIDHVIGVVHKNLRDKETLSKVIDLVHRLEDCRLDCRSGVVIDVDLAIEEAEKVSQIADIWRVILSSKQYQGKEKAAKFAVLYIVKIYREHVFKLGDQDGDFVETTRGHVKIQNNNTQAEEFRKKGNELFGQNEYSQSVEFYTKAAKQDPFCHIYYGNRAQAYHKLDELMGALADGRRAVTIKPDFAKGHYRYAKAFRQLGRLSCAIKGIRVGLNLCQPAAKSDLTNVRQLEELLAQYQKEDKDRKLLTPIPDKLSERLNANPLDDDTTINDMLGVKVPPSKRYTGDLSMFNDTAESCGRDTTKDKSKSTSEKDTKKMKKKKQIEEEKKKKDQEEFQLSRALNAVKKKAGEEKQEFESFLNAGWEAVKSDNPNGPKNALSNYRKALDMIINEEKMKLFGIDDIDIVTLKFVIGISAVKTGLFKNINEGVEKFQDIIDNHQDIRFPLAYFGLGKAYVALFRFSDALEPLEDGKTIARNITYVQITWPGTNTKIPENESGELLTFVWLNKLSGLPRGVMWPGKVVSTDGQHQLVTVYIKSDNAELTVKNENVFPLTADELEKYKDEFQSILVRKKRTSTVHQFLHDLNWIMEEIENQKFYSLPSDSISMTDVDGKQNVNHVDSDRNVQDSESDQDENNADSDQNVTHVDSDGNVQDHENDQDDNNADNEQNVTHVDSDGNVKGNKSDQDENNSDNEQNVTHVNSDGNVQGNESDQDENNADNEQNVTHVDSDGNVQGNKSDQDENNADNEQNVTHVDSDGNVQGNKSDQDENNSDNEQNVINVDSDGNVQGNKSDQDENNCDNEQNVINVDSDGNVQGNEIDQDEQNVTHVDSDGNVQGNKSDQDENNADNEQNVTHVDSDGNVQGNESDQDENNDDGDQNVTHVDSDGNVQGNESDQDENNDDSDQNVTHVDSDGNMQGNESIQDENNADSDQNVTHVDSDQNVQDNESDQDENNADNDQNVINVDSDENVQDNESEVSYNEDDERDLDYVPDSSEEDLKNSDLPDFFKFIQEEMTSIPETEQSSYVVIEHEEPKTINCLNAVKQPDQRRVKEDEMIRDGKYKNIYIKRYVKSNDGKLGLKKDNRPYDTVHACNFCQKLFTHIQDHIEKRHHDMVEVKEILKLRKQMADAEVKGPLKKEIKKLQNCIRFSGDHIHNQLVKDCKQGELLIQRKSCAKEKFNFEDYGPCIDCLQWIKLESSASIHQRNCPKTIGDFRKKRNLILGAKELIGAIEPSGSEMLQKEVFLKMRNDDVSRCAQKDNLICQLGDVWLSKSIGHKLRRGRDSSFHMRLAAKLLLACRERLHMQSIDMFNLLIMKNFDIIVEETLKLCGLNEHEELAHPSTANKLGFDIARLVSLKYGLCLRNKDSDGKEEADGFLKLMKIDWSTKVTKRVGDLLRERHFENRRQLPHPKDIETIAEKLSSTLTAYDFKNKTQYTTVAKTALLRLMVYNRRRSGEIEELLMETFLRRRRDVDDVEQSLLGELTTTERYLIKSQELMWIRGKRGKRVPVLIPQDTIEALKYIVDPEVRTLAGLKKTNKYMFATRGDGVISASQCINELGNENAGDLIHRDRLTSTGYRAYMATIAQCLGLKDHQIQWLCTHLGHTEDIHKTHYRFALDGIERIQLGKLLLIQDKNLLSKFRNTQLEDINFEDIISSVDNRNQEVDPDSLEADKVDDAELEMDGIVEIDPSYSPILATTRPKRVSSDMSLKSFKPSQLRVKRYYPLWKGGHSVYKMPLKITDFTKGIDAIIKSKDSKGKIYQFVGPSAYSMHDLLEYINGSKMAYNYAYINDFLLILAKAQFQAEFYKKIGLAVPKISPDRVERETISDTLDDSLLTLEDLGVTPGNVEDYIQYIIRVAIDINKVVDEFGTVPMPPKPEAAYHTTRAEAMSRRLAMQ